MMPEPISCFNCTHARVYGGYGGSYECPPEPPEFECALADVPDNILEQDEPAETCPLYKPVLINKCGECGKKMNVPENMWNIYAHGMDTVPCCSELCRVRAQGKIDDGIRKEIRECR